MVPSPPAASASGSASYYSTRGNGMCSLGSPTTDAYVAVDVTPAITGSGLVSFAITRTSSTSNTYNSRAATSNRPRLVVTTAPVPPPPPQPTFPIRAAFYYPWFPEAWNQQGFNPFTNYTPTLGFYDSSSSSTIASSTPGTGLPTVVATSSSVDVREVPVPSELSVDV